MDNDLLNVTSEKQSDYLNKELSDNNKKISILRARADELMADVRKCEDRLREEGSDSFNQNEFNSVLEKKIGMYKEQIRINDAKVSSIKREISNLKISIDEGENVKNKNSVKLDELIIIITSINQKNAKINSFMNFMLESMQIKAKFILKEENNIQQVTDGKKKLINTMKEIQSYQEIVENF